MTLLVSSPFAGGLTVAVLTGAAPFEAVELAVSRDVPGAGPCPPAWAGTCWDLPTPHTGAKAVADAHGVAEFHAPMPSRPLPGQTLSWQAVAPRSGIDVALSAVVETEFTTPSEPPGAGNWIDAWGTSHHVNGLRWVDGWSNAFWITTVVNDTTLVAANDLHNAFFPNKFSRFDVSVQDGATWYCQSVYDAATEAEALASRSADETDLAAGCSGFSWTRLDPSPLPVAGSWTDSWGTSHEIEEDTWVDSWGNVFELLDADHDAGWVVAYNADLNPFWPGVYSRFDWTWDADGSLHYCQSVYNAASEQRARAAAGADASDLVAGCSGFSWTRLDP